MLKTKTHRRPNRGKQVDIAADCAAMQRTINRLRGAGVAPRGVYRFSTHEEAQEWQIRQLARLHALRSSKTS